MIIAEFISAKFQNPAGILSDVPVKKGFAPIPPLFELEDPEIVILHLCARPPVAPEKVSCHSTLFTATLII